MKLHSGISLQGSAAQVYSPLPLHVAAPCRLHRSGRCSLRRQLPPHQHASHRALQHNGSLDGGEELLALALASLAGTHALLHLQHHLPLGQECVALQTHAAQCLHLYNSTLLARLSPAINSAMHFMRKGTQEGFACTGNSTPLNDAQWTAMQPTLATSPHSHLRLQRCHAHQAAQQEAVHPAILLACQVATPGGLDERGGIVVADAVRQQVLAPPALYAHCTVVLPLVVHARPLAAPCGLQLHSCRAQRALLLKHARHRAAEQPRLHCRLNGRHGVHPTLQVGAPLACGGSGACSW